MMEIAKIAVGSTTGCCLSRQRIPAGIVGATVSVSFTDPVWDDLEKTVVFRCDESRIAEFDGETAIVPWEVVTQPGLRLYFGIWGHNPKSGLQIPLIEVYLGATELATDPGADPGADPELPIWAELEERMISLEKNLDTQVESSVKEYLEKNPPSGGVQFETDETLTLKNGILSVNTTDRMEQDNTLPMTSAGVFATVGNIEALLKTI